MRYDRQLRLWGDEGQSLVESSRVCVLGSCAVASETLKSLVLAGIHSFHLVDNVAVETRDLGNSFFLESSHLGQPRAVVVLQLLQASSLPH
jgi:amyloid beta precursor protein binding protein 1